MKIRARKRLGIRRTRAHRTWMLVVQGEPKDIRVLGTIAVP